MGRSGDLVNWHLNRSRFLIKPVMQLIRTKTQWVLSKLCNPIGLLKLNWICNFMKITLLDLLLYFCIIQN